MLAPLCVVNAQDVDLLSAMIAETQAVREAKTFTDTKTKAVTRAYALSVVNGVSDTEFAPNNKITRHEALLTVYRTYISANTYGK